jgi:hypothetical protein
MSIMRRAVPFWILMAAFPAVLTIAVVAQPGAPARPTITVYKSATCGCCVNWVEYLREQGFDPVAHTTERVDEIKAQHGVPRQAFSCHTALIDGYVIEGHVPAGDIRRLLKERPAVVGLSVPGMPTGSPGMDGPTPQPYDVLTFDARGQTQVFSSHGR